MNSCTLKNGDKVSVTTVAARDDYNYQIGDIGTVMDLAFIEEKEVTHDTLVYIVFDREEANFYEPDSCVNFRHEVLRAGDLIKEAF